MKNLNIKNAARGILGRNGKCWLLALMLLAAALPAAGMPREAYAEEVETESETVQVEKTETENEENQAGEINAEEDPDEGVTVTITSEPAEEKQTSTTTQAKAVKKISNTVKIPQKSLNTYALIGTYGTKSIANTGTGDLPNLESFITDSKLTQKGVEIPEDGKVVLGEQYTYSVQFSEPDKNGNKFSQDMEFQLPKDVTCNAKENRPIYDEKWLDDDGKMKPAGYYSVDEDGKVTVHLDPEYMNARDNKKMKMDFDLTVSGTGEDGGITFPWEGGSEQTFTTDGNPDANLDKTAGEYLPNDPDGPCVEYKVELQVTKGAVYNPTLEDQMQPGLSYRGGSAEIEIYNEKGELVNKYEKLNETTTPRLVPTTNEDGTTGWKIEGLPSPLEKDWKVVVKYKGDVDLKKLNPTKSESGFNFQVDNKVVFNGNNPVGTPIDPKTAESHVPFTDTVLKKSGKQEEDGTLNWEIEVGSGSSDVRGSKVKDTLTGGHWIDKSHNLQIKWKDENGDTIRTYEIPWDEAETYGLTVKTDTAGHIIGFEYTIPEEGTTKKDKDNRTFWKGTSDDRNREWKQGDRIKIEYYTTHDTLTSEQQKNGVKYKNDVEVKVDRDTTFKTDKEIGIGTGAVNKDVEEQGNYLKYTVNFDIPDAESLAAIVGRDDPDEGSGLRFYLMDQLEFPKDTYKDTEGNEIKARFFVNNVPEDIEIYAVMKSNGSRVDFAKDDPSKSPYFFHVVIDGKDYTTEDDEKKRVREFRILFNTMEGKYTKSFWPLEEACTLTVTYYIPMDARLTCETYGESAETGKEEVTGYFDTDLTLGDLLRQGYKLRNEISGRGQGSGGKLEGRRDYQITPREGDVIKSAEHELLEDGQEVIEYHVYFNAFRENPDKSSKDKYIILEEIIPGTFSLADTFDSRLEYVKGSLYVETLSEEKRVRNRYKYNGDPVIETGDKTTTLTAKADGFNIAEKTDEYSPKDNLVQYLEDIGDATIFHFVYKLKLKDEFMKSGDTNITLNNEAQVNYNGKSGSDDASVSFNPDVLKKEGLKALEDGLDVMQYTIDVNPGAADMATTTSESYNPDHYTLTDEMDRKLVLNDPNSIKVYRIEKKENGEEEKILLERVADQNQVNPDSDYYVFQEAENNTFKLILPDEQHLEIEYSVRINDTIHAEGTVTNKVKLEAGITVEDSNEAKYTMDSDTATITGDAALRLYKRDASKGNYMDGATFTVYTIANGGPIEAKINGVEKKFEKWENIKPTALDGESITSKEGYEGEYYILLETEAPSGYKGDPTPVVFKFGEPPKDKDGKEIEEKVNVTYDEQTYEVTVQYIHAGDNVVVFDNSLNTYELPETGGFGSITYTLAGLLLILGGAFCLMYRRNNIQKGGW